MKCIKNINWWSIRLKNRIKNIGGWRTSSEEAPEYFGAKGALSLKNENIMYDTIFSGFEPLNLRSWVNCSTTVQPKVAHIKNTNYCAKSTWGEKSKNLWFGFLSNCQ
jgi:hypothetical protein